MSEEFSIDFLKKVQGKVMHNINHFIEEEPDVVEILNINEMTDDTYLQDLYIESKVTMYSNLTNSSSILTWALIDYILCKVSQKKSMKDVFSELNKLNEEERDSKSRMAKEKLIQIISNERLEKNVRNNLLHTDNAGYLKGIGHNRLNSQNGNFSYNHVLRHNKFYYGRLVNELISTYENYL